MKGVQIMVYLLVVTEGGEQSFSVYRTRNKAEVERDFLHYTFGTSFLDTEIYELELN